MRLFVISITLKEESRDEVIKGRTDARMGYVWRAWAALMARRTHGGVHPVLESAYKLVLSIRRAWHV